MENFYHINARCQDKHENMVELLKTILKDLVGADSGGHIPAAGGHLPVKYKTIFLDRLKNLKEIVN